MRRTGWQSRKAEAVRKRLATHVDAGAEVPRDAGSIPAASIGRKKSYAIGSSVSRLRSSWKNFLRNSNVPINIEEIIERAFEQAFSKALEQSLQNKTEELFKTAFANGSPLAKKLEAKIEEGFQRFVEEGIKWEKKKVGFKR